MGRESSAVDFQGHRDARSSGVIGSRELETDNALRHLLPTPLKLDHRVNSPGECPRMLKVIDLGRMEYEACVELQRDHLEKVAEGNEPHTIFFVEHPPVLTLGSDFHEANLLLPLAEYEANGIQIFRTDRGGDVTYHGPGQLVIYPIFNVGELGKDLHKWLRNLEETIILTLKNYGIEGQRLPVNTGVWVGNSKIAAIGIKVRRWVSMHGIALNCNPDMTPFQMIIPCGIQGHGVTSISLELGTDVTIEDAKPHVADSFRQVFNLALSE